MSTRLKNRIAKIEAEKGLGSQPIIVVTNFGSDCEKEWKKAQEVAISKYKENNKLLKTRYVKIIRIKFE